MTREIRRTYISLTARISRASDEGLNFEGAVPWAVWRTRCIRAIQGSLTPSLDATCEVPSATHQVLCMRHGMSPRRAQWAGSYEDRLAE